MLGAHAPLKPSPADDKIGEVWSRRLLPFDRHGNQAALIEREHGSFVLRLSIGSERPTLAGARCLNAPEKLTDPGARELEAPAATHNLERFQEQCLPKPQRGTKIR